MKIHFDATSNILKNPEIRKKIECALINEFNNELPERLNRMGKISSFITLEVGFYSQLLNEAKKCYELGLYYATIAMIGITAERFSIELFEKVNFKINEQNIKQEELIGGNLKQYRRLELLKKAEIINKDTYQDLKKISEIRNKYIHPKMKKSPEKDSLEILNIFLKLIQSRFSDKYIIKNGKIVGR